MHIRPATTDDVPAIRDIYNRYVVETPITFDIEPKSLDDRLQWFAQFEESGRHRIFVAELDGAIKGYACTGGLRPKAAYDSSVEVTIYVDIDGKKRGVGRALYTELFAALQDVEIHRAYAVITLPNPASVIIHEQFGFTLMGVMSEVGRKFDKYWDVAWYEKSL